METYYVKTVRIFASLLLILLTSCGKSGVTNEGEVPQVTGIITKGSWVMTYSEGGVIVDMGSIAIAFTGDGKLAGNQNGSQFTGTWSETKNANEHTLTLNLVTSDVNLSKTNGKWKVIIATSNHIDITDPDVTKRNTVHLNK